MQRIRQRRLRLHRLLRARSSASTPAASALAAASTALAATLATLAVLLKYLWTLHLSAARHILWPYVRCLGDVAVRLWRLLPTHSATSLQPTLRRSERR